MKTATRQTTSTSAVLRMADPAPRDSTPVLNESIHPQRLKRQRGIVEIRGDIHDNLRTASAAREMTIAAYVEFLLEFALSSVPLVKHMRDEHERNAALLRSHLQLQPIRRRSPSLAASGGKDRGKVTETAAAE